VTVISASTGMFGGVWAQAELRKVLGATGARVVEGDVAVGHAHTRFDQEDRLNDALIAEQVSSVALTLLNHLDEDRQVAA
jgi:chromate reductase